MMWDQGRGLAGVTTVVEGHHVSVIALRYAHGHQIPYVSVNTCVHEILHAVLGDVYAPRKNPAEDAAREFRVDWFATRLWLFREGAALHRAAELYVERLQDGV